MKRTKKRPYRSLQDWMERTRTSQTKLARLSGITQSHLSYLLTGSRRCSIQKALVLSRITGVPVEKLVKWEADDSPAKSEQTFKSDPRVPEAL
jgi:plasmid maintenance system antidote protein VapI